MIKSNTRVEINEEVDRISNLNLSNTTNNTLYKNYNESVYINLQLYKNLIVLKNKTFKIELEMIHKSNLDSLNSKFTPIALEYYNYTTDFDGKIQIKYYIIYH